MEKVVKRFENMMLGSVIFAILDIIMGIVFLNFTDFAMKINIIILGSLITIHGLFYVIRYVYDGLGNKFFAVDLIAGIACVILGVFTIFNPFDALKVIGIMFCIWLCFSGLEKIYYGFVFMSHQEEIYPLVSFIGILMIIMGILCAFNPFSGFVLITRLIGLFLICSGALDTMVSILYRKRAKNILKLFK